MGKEKYYVVLVGRHPGIYFTWDDARVEVEGFSGARHRAFKNWKEAVACWESYFGKAREPSRPITDYPIHQIAASSAEVDIPLTTTSSIRQTTQPTMVVVERATSTDNLGLSDSEKLVALLVGVSKLLAASISDFPEYVSEVKRIRTVHPVGATKLSKPPNHQVT
ncbi:uncharacterized protein LOC131247081 [Magnolia sinica]|uniref:uncharacterized protein LOC131247081 n=1 Tax=Magnolia sinica TaxID=86752 RepID=UPI0026581848|nr:uncharacterized protein LOC131247081 [Magnolia sinica]